MDRNEFMKRLGLLTFGGSLLSQASQANMPEMAGIPFLKNIGVQLFSLPAALEKDFEGTIDLLAGMGYRQIELFGPYLFSADSAKTSWNAVSEMLGFSGSGYFGRSAKELKGIFDARGLKVPAAHTDLDTLVNRMEYLGDAGDALGFKYVILPAIPDERRQSLDDYKKMAEVFNEIGRNAKRHGLRFAYHNHGYGLSEVSGAIPFEVLLENTDPQLVFLEMDLFWTIAGRVDPLKYLEKYSGRYKLMHVKDMKEIKTFSGDGNDAGQWFELFPNMASAGEGEVDLASIIPFARKHGVKHFFVEQDLVKDPETALQKSIDYLKKI